MSVAYRWSLFAYLIACNKTEPSPAPLPSATAAPAPTQERQATAVEADLYHPRSLVVDKGFLYWVDDDRDTAESPDKVTTSSILRVSVKGGTPSVIASHRDDMGMDNGRQLAVYGDSVYWICGEDHRFIFAAPVGGGAIRKIAPAASLGSPLAVDATGIYWTDSDSLKFVPFAGGTVKTLSTEPTNGLAADVLLDAHYVYWTSLPKSLDAAGKYLGHTVRAPRSGGGAIELSAFHGLSPGVHALAVDDDFLYVADSADGKSAGTISMVPIAGGASKVLAEILLPWSLAVDKSYVYAVSAGRKGVIARIAKTNGATIVLATDQPYPKSLAMDDSFVYWTNSGDGIGAGTIQRVQK